MTLTKDQLVAAHCWETGDLLPGRPLMTEFRRRTRYHQAQWREANRLPIGSEPFAPRPDGRMRLVGSRLPLAYAVQTGANFLSGDALVAVRSRTSTVERHQSLDRQRLWADLLSSEALAFNLFGDLAADRALADRAVHALWPDTPGTVCDVRFAYSPGRLDPGYLNSLRAFDAAFILDIGDGTQGIVAIDTKYHEWGKPETPKPGNLQRYTEVAERSGIFAPGAIEALGQRSAHALMWLEHLLLLSMLQHPDRSWTWGRYLVIHPAGNVDFVDLCARYRDRLVEHTTFSALSLEGVLDTAALASDTIANLRERYVPPEP